MLTVGHVLTGSELTTLQQNAEGHLAFSLTEACPLRCAHCIVATLPAKELPRVTLSVEQARRYAAELPQLAERGIARISYTGGEPVLAREVLQLLSQAAAEAGIGNTLVTACHWAKTDQAADRTVAALPHIDSWHLSADRFHAEFLPVECVIRAAHAVLRAGRSATLRMAVPLPVSAEDEAFHARLTAELPSGVPIAVQPVSKVGRAESLELDVPKQTRPSLPCMSTGPVVRWDGSVSPCCSSLIDWRDRHPFQMQKASATGLLAMHEAWRTHALLRLVRSVGFQPVLRWLEEDDPEHPILKDTPDHPCDVCTGLWRRPGTAALVQKRLGVPDTREKIDALYQIVLGRRAAPQPPSEVP